MGVENLYKFIKEYAPEAITPVTLKDLRGKRIYIDASISIYQWYSVGQSKSIVNQHGKPINHLQGALFRTAGLLLAGATPVYVFDGRPPAIKGATLGRRRAQRAAGKCVHVPRWVFDEVRTLLGLMGVATVTAPSEADAQIAYYQRRDATGSLVASDDLDTLVFGAADLLRGLGGSMVVINRAAVLAHSGLSNSQFIDLCILLGCDYTRKIPGIGYKRAVEYITQYSSIEGILGAGKAVAPADFDFLGAREEFLRPRVGAVAAGRAEYSGPRLLEFLTAHKLAPARIRRTLGELSDFYSKK
jgi:flap endonuclease-1